MANEPKPARARREAWQPQPETQALLQVSGNPINGVGETAPRRASPFFWHPPELHPWGGLQILARKNSRKCPGSTEAFQAAYTPPELISVAAEKEQASPEEFSAAAMEFAVSHEADQAGIAAMDPMYVFEGYMIEEPWVIMLALAHNYERRGRYHRMRPTAKASAMSATNTREACALLLRWPIGSARKATMPSRTRVLLPARW